jgi:hypothetical protein
METLTDLQTKVDKTILLLDKIFQKPLDTIKLSPVESAQLLALLASTIHTLLFIYSKSNGSSTVLVKKELKRCKQMFEKINSAQVKKIDVDAAKRFIHHSIK